MKRYAHILDEDRRALASEMEQQFYQGGGNLESSHAEIPKSTPAVDANTLASLLTSNSELLAKVLAPIQFANRT